MAYTKKTWVNVPDPSKFTKEQLDSFPRFDADNMNRIEEGIEEHINDGFAHNSATNGGGAVGRDAQATIGGAVGGGAKTTIGGAVGRNASANDGGAVGDGAKTTIGGAIGTGSQSADGGAIGAGAQATIGGAVGAGAKETNGSAAVGYKASATNGGGAVGYESKVDSGAAVGYRANATTGGAVGGNANTTSGGAVGLNTKSGKGFAGGVSAQTVNTNGDPIDAIQLGTGTNSIAQTLQIYNYLLMNADGTIPVERMASKIAKIQTRTFDGSGLGNPVTLTFDFTPKIVFVQCKTSGVSHTMAIMINGVNEIGTLPTLSASKIATVTWNDKSVTFVASTESTINKSGYTYSCVALG